MPTAVAAARQSYADHPMVRLETAPPGPCHAVSLQETLSGTFTACATVILEAAPWDRLGVGRIVEVDIGRIPPPDEMTYDEVYAVGALCEKRGLDIVDTLRWAHVLMQWDIDPVDVERLAGAAVRLIDGADPDAGEPARPHIPAGTIRAVDPTLVGHAAFTDAERRHCVVAVSASAGPNGNLVGRVVQIHDTSGAALGGGPIVALDRSPFPGVVAPRLPIRGTRFAQSERNIGLAGLELTVGRDRRDFRRWALVDVAWDGAAPHILHLAGGTVRLMETAGEVA